MRHNFIDRFSGLDSPLHALDPRAKIVGFLSLLVAILLVPPGETAVLLGFFLVLAILLVVSRIPLVFTARRTLVLLPFLILSGLGAGLERFEPARLGDFLARSLMSLGILVLLTNTTRFSDLLRALRRLGCPRILALTLGFLYRYLFVLTDEALRMRQARDCRRVGRGPARAELRLLGAMLGTMLVRSFERADRMYQAMLARAFGGEFPVFNPSAFGWPDAGFLSCVAAVLLAAYLAVRP